MTIISMVACVVQVRLGFVVDRLGPCPTLLAGLLVLLVPGVLLLNRDTLALKAAAPAFGAMMDHGQYHCVPLGLALMQRALIAGAFKVRRVRCKALVAA